MAKTLKGVLSDYRVSPYAGGVLLASAAYGATTAQNGEKIHFDGDSRDFEVENFKLVALDTPSSAAPVSPTPAPRTLTKVVLHFSDGTSKEWYP